MADHGGLTPSEGFQHPACYAAAIGDCSTKISREHTLSATVLDIFATEDGVDLGGLTWMPDGERKQLPVVAVASNVLCSHHNSVLAELDAFAGGFVNRLYEIHLEMRTRRRRRPPTLDVFSGDTLERWLLKCLCGLIVSGTIESKGLTDPQRWRPPTEWLAILFGTASMPEGQGLYFLGQPGERREGVPAFEFGVHSNSSTGPYGLSAALMEKRFLLAMAPPVTAGPSLLRGAMHRPVEFVARNGINQSVVKLDWTGPAGGGVVIRHDNPRRSG